MQSTDAGRLSLKNILFIAPPIRMIMNNWKYLIANGCITAVLIAAGITLLLPVMQGGDPPFAAALDRKTASIEERLARMEKALAGRESAAVPVPKQGDAAFKDAGDISAKLDAILTRLGSIEARIGNEPRAGMRGLPMAGAPGMSGRGPAPGDDGRPRTWIDNLPEEKQMAVRQIFRDNATMGREKFGAEREEGRLSPERMKEIKDEHDAFLKERLQEVLTDEEYESYLESLPERRLEKMGSPSLPQQRPNADR